jgi:hypothetical protein
MNDFALDGGELNGQPEVWLITESPAAVSLSLSGGVNKARFVEALASVNLASSFKSAIRVGIGSADGYGITLSAWLPPSVRKGIASASAARVDASAALLRQAMAGGLSSVSIDLDGDIKVFGDPRCLLQLKLASHADARVSHARHIKCRQAMICLSSESFERVTPATMLESRVQHWLHSFGRIRRDSYSSTGKAEIKISGDGEARKGAKVNIEGSASVFVEVYSRGVLGGIRYRYLSAEAAMQILIAWNPVGHPVQPDVYIPAQEERLLFVDRDDRVISVPSEVA